MPKRENMIDPRKTFQNLPENTKYDKRRHEEMRLKPIRYGFFKVAKEEIEPLVCSICINDINGESVIIDKKPFHPKCYNESRCDT